MRRIGICWLVLAALAATPPALAQGDPAARIEAVKNHLERLEKLGFAGVFVATQGGVPILAEGYGLADRAAGLPWTPGTVSTIGSLTKQFTGATVLMLAEEGKLAVEDSIAEYFDAVPEDKVGITLHQLLTHSSGIVDLEGVGDWDPIGREEFVRRILDQDLAFVPGEGYRYSNAGYSLLGAIVEQLTGSSYESTLRRRALIPNGLFETGYLQAGWGEGRIAQGYRRGESWGTVLGRPMADDGPYWVLRANGGIHSTAWEMVRWGQALLDGRALSPRSMELYWAPHVDEGGGESFYGYGWVVRDAGGARVVSHNGSNGIFYADMAIIPDAKSILVYMTNVASEFPVARQLFGQVGYFLLAGRPLPPVPELVEVEAGALEPLTGLYELPAESGGGRLEVALAQRDSGPRELTIRPADPVAFGRLFSTRPYDPRRGESLSARLDEIVGASLGGDLEPLAAAYDHRVTAEYLAGRWAEERQRLEEAHGDLTGSRVLGTAFQDGRDVTLVRIEFAEGWVDRAYVWDADADAELRGVSRQGLDDRLHVLPGPDGSFATWDGRSGESRVVRFEELGGGGYRLVIGEEPAVVATRLPE
ncbi:MAG: serine hydrolase domain-containing protein [Thermoanaerobaculia bacterium]|nr:serine hydrolase domain-containing protein [Thermoanaerobaculia bacterium]